MSRRLRFSHKYSHFNKCTAEKKYIQAQSPLETYSVYDVNHKDGTTVADATMVVSRAIETITEDPQVVDAAVLNRVLQQIDARLAAIEAKLGLVAPEDSAPDVEPDPEDPASDPFNGGNTSYSLAAFNALKAEVCPDGVLVMEYDAAHVNWEGDWRMLYAIQYQWSVDAKQSSILWNDYPSSHCALRVSQIILDGIMYFFAV